MTGVVIPDPRGGHVWIYGKDGSGNPVKVLVDAAGNLQIDTVTSALPTGAATSAKQDDIITELQNLSSDVFAPIGAQYVVLALDGSLTNESLHSGLSGADLHDPKGHKASHAGGGADKLKHTRQILFFDLTAAIATGTDKLATIVYRGPTLTLVRWDMRAKTAPTNADMIFDVNVAGTSLWDSTQANRPTIAASATSGTGTSFDTTTLSDGDVLTLDYDQVGSGTAGGQVTLTLEGECNLETD